jgi:ATP-dependent helicase/nuclease subunit B
VLLVPEQATFQTEYALTLTPGLSGMFRAQVLSFRRLAWRVFAEVGGAARPHIGDVGKRMLLARILARRRGELRLFGRAAGRYGFSGTLAGALSELKTCLVTPEALERTGCMLPGTVETYSLQAKLEDLRLLYADFERELAGKYVDPDDYLTLLAARLGESPTLRGAEVWVDGFAGFTPQEYAVLAALLKTAARVNVALCLDPRSRRREDRDLFQVTRGTRARLAELARKNGVKLAQPVELAASPPARFRANPALVHLEREFFRRPTQKFAGAPFEGTVPVPLSNEGAMPVPLSNLRLVAAVSRRAEVEGAAREILRLCRERGWHWRDFSLVVRNLADYHELVATVFADYGIPCFIDRKRPVRHHPLVELIRSALETVIGNWAYDPVFRYLKTDLVPVSRADVDLLENYVLAHGIRGGAKWADEADWHYERPHALGGDIPTRPTGVGAPDRYLRRKVNRVRRQAARHLLDFQRRVLFAATARDFTAALYDLLTALSVPRRIEAWSREAEAEGRLEAAREHRQLWAGVVALFDQVVEALGDEALTAEEFGRVLDSGMDGLQLALIPPALDQVLVGSLERSRNPDVRAAFVLGVSEGVLPGRHRDTGLFTDREREALLAAGLEVAPDTRRKVYEEQYLVYIALTRASEYLWVSYPLADEEGRAMAPSSVIPRLRELFPGLGEETLALEPDGSAPGADLPYVTTPGRTLGFLVARLRDWKAGVPVDPVWWSVFNWFADNGDGRRERCAPALAGLFFENREPPLDPDLAQALYGGAPAQGPRAERPSGAPAPDTHASGSGQVGSGGIGSGGVGLGQVWSGGIESGRVGSGQLVVSVSRLEKFRGCPFAHFARYALRLKEREVCRLEAPDIGQFFHEALRTFDGRLRESGVEWHALESAECERLASEVVEELAPRLQSEILLSTSRHRFLTGKLKRVVQRTAGVMAAHARRSAFRPVAVEVPFGPGQAVPGPSYPLPDGGRVELAGRVDRVDVAHTQEAAYLRVIDYKAGPRSLALDDVYHGLNLQLLVYLDACLGGAPVLVGRECLPAGAFYFRVQNPLLRGGKPLPAADAAAQLLNAFRMQGLVLGDPALLRLMDGAVAGESLIVPAGLNKDGTVKKKAAVVSAAQFERLLEHVRRMIVETAAQIQGGAVGIAPYRKGGVGACRYCAFKPLCAFDPLLASNRYRLLRRLPPAEMWRLLGPAGEGEAADE